VEPYVEFLSLVEDAQHEYDDPGPVVDHSEVPIRGNLIHALERARVRLDLLGTVPVRDWGFRVVLILSHLFDEQPRDAEKNFHLRAKLHDARLELAIALRKELGLLGVREWSRTERAHETHVDWLKEPPTADGMANARTPQIVT
jgi:hypothetical protein